MAFLKEQLGIVSCPFAATRTTGAVTSLRDP
jgi:hypothetical protein